jgi:hypothetical protein
VPGEAFGSRDHIRISFSCAMNTIEEGMRTDRGSDRIGVPRRASRQAEIRWAPFRKDARNGAHRGLTQDSLVVGSVFHTARRPWQVAVHWLMYVMSFEQVTGTTSFVQAQSWSQPVAPLQVARHLLA